MGVRKYHLRSSVEDIIYFLCKPQVNFLKQEKKGWEVLELTLWPYVIFLFSLFTISIQVNLSALRKSDEKN